MNKQGLVEIVAGDISESKAEAERVVSAVLNAVKKGLKKDKIVNIIGFGKFSLRQLKARKGRNPKTGEAIDIKASKTVGFKAGKELKSSL